MRIKDMGQKEILEILLEALGDYVASYDNAVEQLETTFDRDRRIEWEKVIGNCVARIAMLKDAILDMTKPKTRDALKQCLGDSEAAYEDARAAAEVCLLTQRAGFENIKGRCVKRRLLIRAALQELT